VEERKEGMRQKKNERAAGNKRIVKQGEKRKRRQGKEDHAERGVIISVSPYEFARAQA
jgi:hypothetical protein